MPAIYWLFIMIGLLAVEIPTMGLTTIWFAGGALAAFPVALAGLGLPVQVAVFVGVSLVLLVFTRPIAQKHLNRRTVKTNVESLVGRTALVTQAIDNKKAEGQVQIEGVIWTARSADGNAIPEGASVRIEKVNGVKLIVTLTKEGVD